MPAIALLLIVGASLWLLADLAGASVVEEVAGDLAAGPAQDALLGAVNDATAPADQATLPSLTPVPLGPDPGAGAGLFQTLGVTLSRIYTPPAAAAPYQGAIDAAEAANGIPAGLLARQLQAESNFNPNAVSPVGAVGIAQFMPATAQDLGIDQTDPFASINAAAKYMKQLYDKTGSWVSALAAYNWGIGNVLKKGTANLPAETQKYVDAITTDVPVS